MGFIIFIRTWGQSGSSLQPSPLVTGCQPLWGGRETLKAVRNVSKNNSSRHKGKGLRCRDDGIVWGDKLIVRALMKRKYPALLREFLLSCDLVKKLTWNFCLPTVTDPTASHAAPQASPGSGSLRFRI